MICRDDSEFRWQLLMCENELFLVSLLLNKKISNEIKIKDVGMKKSATGPQCKKRN